MSSCFRDTTRAEHSEPSPGSGCARRDGFNHAQVMATCSTATIMLWGAVAWTFRDNAANWWRLMLGATSLSDLASDLSEFGSPEWRAGSPSDKDLQRSEGSGRLVVSGSEKGTRIMDIFQRSPIRILFPRTGGGALEEAVL